MKRLISLLLSLLLPLTLSLPSLAAESEAASGVYAESLISLPEGFASIAAMAAAPDGTLFAAAKSAEGVWNLLRWDSLDAAPAVIPLALGDEENIASLQVAPDGQILAVLQMSGISFSRGSGGGGLENSAQGSGGEMAVNDSVPSGGSASSESSASPNSSSPSGGTSAGGQGQRMSLGNLSTTLLWLDASGAETARLTLQGYVQRTAALSDRRVAAIAGMQDIGMSIYDERGEMLDSPISAADATGLAAGTESLFIAGEEAITEWSLQTGEALRTIDMQADYSSQTAAAADGTLYLTGTQGVYRIAPGETTATLILGAIGTLFGDPSNSISAFSALPDGRLVALLTSGSLGGGAIMGRTAVSFAMGGSDSETYLAVYTRIEGLDAASLTPFVITALNDSTRLRKAVSDFQRAHPELRVELQVQMQSQGFFGAETVADDYIRALNTELLAGGGGDVIILDGLPIEKYAKKGILADLSGLLGELNLLPGIAESIQSADGKVYAIPAQFTFPMLWGRAEITDLVGSLSDIMSIPLAADQRPMSARTPEEWIRLLYPASQAAFTNGSGTVTFDSAEFAAFLETLYTLYSEQDETANQQFGGFRRGGMSPDEMLAMLNGVVALYPTTVSSLMMLSTAYSISGADLARGILMPSIDGSGTSYTPSLLAGINAQSKQRELAEELVRLLFTDETQETDQISGLPTTTSALDTLFEEAIERSQDENLTTMMAIQGGAQLTMEQPSEEALRALRTECDSLATPIYLDETLLGFIIEETARFFEGGMSAQDAARAIEQRAFFYQNE